MPVRLHLPVGLIVFLGAIRAPAALSQQEELTQRHYDIGGCYELSFTAQRPPEWIGDLETKIWLTTVELLAGDRGSANRRFVVRPAPGERGSTYPNIYWLVAPDGEQVHVIWHSGMDRTQVSLALDAGLAELQGKASYFSDTLRHPAQPTPVTAIRIHCDD